MRLSRVLLLAVAAFAATACKDDDGVTVNARPPLGGVRLINAVPDGGPVDIRMVDQVEWSVSSVNTTTTLGLPFRSGTIHWATEAKARRIRVFPTDSNIAVTSTILHDTTITVEANKNVTLMLVGSRAAGGKVSFVKIDDEVPALTDAQIAVRLVNASYAGQTPAAVDGYITATATTAIAGSAAWANVAPGTAGAYLVRATGALAVRAAAAGTTTPLWSAAAPTGAPSSAGIAALAGATAGGSGLSAYVFPRACPAAATPLTTANCPAAAGRTAAQITAYSSPAVIWFVDRVPPPVTTTP